MNGNKVTASDCGMRRGCVREGCGGSCGWRGVRRVYDAGGVVCEVVHLAMKVVVLTTAFRSLRLESSKHSNDRTFGRR